VVGGGETQLGGAASSMKTAIVVMTYLIAVAAFIAVAGYDEHSMLNDGVQTYDEAGQLRLLTQQEISRDVRSAALSSIPVAFIYSGILFPVGLWFSKSLRSMPRSGAVALGALAGLLCGGLLSFIVYAVIGGWGPAFLRPTGAAGALLFGVAAWIRGRVAGASTQHVGGS
jgi:hypothetical protein